LETKLASETTFVYGERSIAREFTWILFDFFLPSVPTLFIFLYRQCMRLWVQYCVFFCNVRELLYYVVSISNQPRIDQSAKIVHLRTVRYMVTTIDKHTLWKTILIPSICVEHVIQTTMLG
jgi:hypothetical protein